MKSRRHPSLLVIGQTPPPYNGMTVVTQQLLESSLPGRFRMALVDIADRRSVARVGRVDGRNIALAIKHFALFLRALAAGRPDVVYMTIAQTSIGYLRDCLFLVPSLLARRRVVVHLHGGSFAQFFSGAPAPVRWIVRSTLGKVAGAIVLAKGLRGQFDRLVPSGRVFVVENGVAVEDADRSPRPGGDPVVVYLSNLRRSKGFLDVIRSAALCAAALPNARFVLAGEPCSTLEMAEAENLLLRGELSKRVCILGPVSGQEKWALLRSADIFVFPPIAPEGQPLVILEAMAAGLPVVTTPQGAIPETVIDGRTGFLVAPGDPAALADRIVRLARSDELRRTMGQAGRRRYEERYTAERWARDLEAVLLQAAGRSWPDHAEVT